MGERRATADDGTPVTMPMWVRTGHGVGGATTAVLLGGLLYALFTNAFTLPAGKAAGLVIAAPFVVGLGVGYAICHPRNARVRPVPGGFRIDRRGTVRDIPTESVRRIALAYVTNVTKSSESHQCRVDLDIAGDATPLRLFGPSYAIHTPDPLGWLVADVQNALATAAVADLPHGDALRGDGWTLTHDALSVRKPRLTLPLDDIGTFGMADGDVCVWRPGEGRPAVRISSAGPNATVLHEVLRRRVPFDAARAIATDAFGRVLFERPSNARGLWGVTVAFAAALGGVFAYAGIWPVAAGLWAVAAGALAGMALAWRAGWSFSERGAEQRGVFGTRRLMYADAGTVTLKQTDYYRHGQYERTAVVFTVAPETGHPGRRVRFAASGGRDHAIVQVCDWVSRAVAARLREELDASGAAYWTTKLEFEPGGLRTRKGVISYRDITGHDLAGGTLTVHAAGAKPLTVPASAPNFWPGYLLLQQLIAAPPTPGRERRGRGDQTPTGTRAGVAGALCSAFTARASRRTPSPISASVATP